MAPADGRKRKASAAGEEVFEVETASSSLSRASLNKRQRVSDTINGDAPTDIEDDVLADLPSDTDDRDGHENGHLNDEPFDYATQRDAGLDDDQPDETEQQRAIEQIQERASRFTENHAAENAIIEEVQCTNFMCHSRLTIELGPLINFIIGHNGSGKSAVLTALQLCLGGKTTVTNRGQKLSDFIKQGSDSASLSVRIKNQGPSAYNPDVYGQSIIVERHFTKTGTSGFKIKNSQGKVISTKKLDLEDITDAFALQLDNPMMCLTQDQAREFLNNSGPKEKYKFFFKGTQLETLDNDYQIMSDTLNNLELKLDTLEENKKYARSLFRKAKDNVDKLKATDGLKDQYYKYERQMAWCQVEHEEKKLARADDEIREIQTKIEGKKADADDKSKDYDVANAAAEQAHVEVQECESKAEPIKEEQSHAQEEFARIRKEVAETLQQHRDIGGDLSAAKKRREKLQMEIATEERRIADANGGQHAEKVDELSTAKEKATQLENELQESSKGFRELELAKKAADNAVNEAKPRGKSKRDELEKCKANIERLESSRGKWIKAYPSPDNLQKLLDLIQREQHRFKDKPVGPMGHFVRILKPEWTSIVERLFGGNYNAFLCTNKDDQRILSQLMKQARWEQMSLLIDKMPINTTTNEPDSDVVTVLRILEFDNELARNAAIINQAAEQIALVRNRDEANEFMFPKNGPRPRSVRATLCMHETRRGAGFRLQPGSGGGESFSPMPSWGGGLTRMNTNSDYQLREEQEHLQILNREYKETQDQLRELEKAIKEASQAIFRHDRDHKRIKLQSQQARDRANALHDEIEAETAQPDQLLLLEGQLRSAEEEERNTEVQFQGAFEDLNRINAESRAQKSKLDDLEKQISDLSTQQSKLAIREQKAAVRRETALKKKNEALAIVRDAERDLENVYQDKKRQEDVVAEHIRQASLISERVEVEPGRTADSLDQTLTEIRRKITQTQTQLGGDKVELKRRALDAKEHRDRETARFVEADKICKALKFARKQRLDRWQMFRRFISVRARNQFMYLLSNRKFRGQLKLYHKEKLLEIQVEPDITRASDKGRQTKTLSGGEKSYSTICLLLSLWDAMGSPIRCLDEFDVFMDNVNRDVSMKMMIEAARQSVSKQFILISPQSMNASHIGNDVTVIKMSDPERGQQPLPSGFTRERR
ncbi:P-loop containing nucleoside triphosphate hydrolase protein [Rhizodiscina lignyota]|uniref:P-loop containing nucleoside triphosphate hydrolase protein n=1 Tax=Rhizodiscina lignyota TaxID=1504668 RepID=A0A9P4II02_9PEZI|nr:P-loop containing nucleoside triphosphate hydrolase protein [Rhizodiscina lignyota]